ncbi:hypothetical protein ACOM2C_02680 [Pseudarthrobacter sp. So.54]
MDIIDDQHHRLGELLKCAEQEVIGRRPVEGEILAQRQQGIVARQRLRACCGLDRPNNSMKEPGWLGVEPVQRQPPARQIAIAHPITQERGLAVAGWRRNDGDPVGIRGSGHSIFEARTFQGPLGAQGRPDSRPRTMDPCGDLRLYHGIHRRDVHVGRTVPFGPCGSVT